MSGGDLRQFARDIDAKGWAVTSAVIDPILVSVLRSEVALLATDGRGGARNLLDNAAVRELAASDTVRSFAEAVLGDRCFAVRALLFDKTPDANWKVVWHQDLTIATRERCDVPGFGPWTEKAGVPHTQPPVDVLQQMLALRVHLDRCGTENGPVRVVDGTHRLGRIAAADIDRIRETQTAHDCVVEEGGLLAFRPLLLHASAPARRPSHRRVIHMEFSAVELPAPLQWHARVQ
jgi:ectoine hydroxylase-related dioxygenase (phytanoyl-CoA dioxygenase family)